MDGRTMDPLGMQQQCYRSVLIFDEEIGAHDGLILFSSSGPQQIVHGLGPTAGRQVRSCHPDVTVGAKDDAVAEVRLSLQGGA
ncbi:hypothetical protein M758_7G159800 [Ceratodon purpureus]|nr:hypothetical protein KC19_N014800 [Ceratodon purpureus]KAG0611704.1 hypothetical protein M758_7G159800 [Ceratodon purpureus]